MADKPQSGEVLGIPYNFERPSMGRMVSSYWQPGREMLVKKPFGIGYTLNMANWRSWIVLVVVAALLWQERSSGSDTAAVSDEDGPVEVVVDDD